jgi:hypothetical protein
MLAHSISRLLDRHKEYDVDAANFMARYRLFTRKKLADRIRALFSRPGLNKKTEHVKTV